jgi:nucleoside-diphosphate-sugar epimerase
MGKKVVITGISGTIAKYLIPGLSAQGCTVTALSRRSVTNRYGVRVLEGSLTDSDFVNRALEGADTVIHAAALSRSVDPAKLKMSNEDVTEFLVNSAILNGVRRFIFFSSDLAHNPVGPYGRSKLACEEIIARSLLQDWAIFRLNPFLGDIGVNENSTFAKLIDTARSGRRLWLPGGGNFMVAPVCASDLNRLVSAAVAHQGGLRRAYHVTGDRASLREMIYMSAVDARIGYAPMALVKLAIALLSLLSVRHPKFESLQALGRPPAPACEALESDFGFKPCSLGDMLKPRS